MIAYTEIEIIPYEGQHEPKELVSGTTTSNEHNEQENTEPVKATVSAEASTAQKIQVKPERKTIAQPTGKLQSANLGIKATLNPPKKKGVEDDEDLPESHESYSDEDFQKHWNNYAYRLKNANRDSLFTTLTRSELTVGSDHVIRMKIKNHQVNELESEKIQLLRHMRFHLKNTNINLVYEVEEAEVVTVLDSKATFEKLADENASLNKLRKMFNLDIEF